MKSALLIITLIVLLLLGADYQGLLGTRTNTYVDYINVEFVAEDGGSGKHIKDFVANCTRKGSRHACSIEQGWNKSSRLIKFGVPKKQVKSWLFKQGESLIGSGDVDISIMFIHPDYERLSETYTLGDLLAMQDDPQKITLHKSVSGSQPNE